MSKRYKKTQEQNILELIIVGIGKLLWLLITLPFKKGQRSKGISGSDRAEITNRRLEIEKLLISDSEIELRHAVIEADKLVDYVLKLKGYQGETFADRLRSAEKYMDKSTYQSIWEGHKVRNTLAHEHQVNMSRDELVRAVHNLFNYIKQN